MIEQLTVATESTISPLWLRMSSHDEASPQPSQLVRVTAQRCTIGSDKTCNLQLPAEGLDPVHCLIVRGAQRTIVRRWSPDTHLNGGEFVDAVLAPGDRLVVGDCEFEVLDSETASQGAAEHVIDVVDEPGASLREIAQQQWQTVARLRQACELNRARARRMARRLREYQHGAQVDSRSAAPRETSVQTEQLVAQPVPSAADTFAGEEHAAADVDPGATAEMPEPVEELRFEAVKDDAPVTAAALLQRLGAALPDSEPEETPRDRPAERGRAANRSEPELPSTPPAARPAEPAEGGEKDESIDDYMALLLQRVSNKPVGKSETYRPSSSAPAAPAAAAPPPATKNVEVQERPTLLTELPTRSVVAPEHAANMSAMRELAHLHSRSVLDIHFRRLFLRTSVGQILVIAAGLIAGMAFTLLSFHVPMALFPGLIGFAVAIVWGAQYAAAVWQVAASRRRASVPPAMAPNARKPDAAIDGRVAAGAETSKVDDDASMPLGVEE